MKEYQNTPAQPSLTVCVIGDSCSDNYHTGTVNRISAEAPVPVLDYDHSVQRPGMAGNVCENLRNLGARVKAYISCREIKHRYLDQRSGQQLLRMDQPLKTASEIRPDQIDFAGADAVIISDYCKGTVTDDIYAHVRKQFAGPVFVDTKRRDLRCCDQMIVKLNHTEHSNLIHRGNPQELIVTQGNQGAVWNNTTYPAKAVNVFDVCGAGDTFLAALTYWYLISNSIGDAIEYANCAAAVTVQHRGVYAPTTEEIQHEITRSG